MKGGGQDDRDELQEQQARAAVRQAYTKLAEDYDLEYLEALAKVSGGTALQRYAEATSSAAVAVDDRASRIAQRFIEGAKKATAILHDIRALKEGRAVHEDAVEAAMKAHTLEEGLKELALEIARATQRSS